MQAVVVASQRLYREIAFKTSLQGIQYCQSAHLIKYHLRREWIKFILRFKKKKRLKLKSSKEATNFLT